MTLEVFGMEGVVFRGEECPLKYEKFKKTKIK